MPWARCFILLFIIVILPHWQLVQNKNGIQTYARSVKNSAYVEVKGVTTVKTSLAQLVYLLHDAYSGCRSWMNSCAEKKLLKRVGPYTAYYYHVSETPWPFKNRDIVVRSRIDQHKQSKKIVIHLEGLPRYLPKKTKYVRLKKFSGQWILIPLKKGSVRLVYQVFIEPGGNLKPFLVNRFTKDNPFRALKMLKQVIHLPRYQGAKMAGILEP